MKTMSRIRDHACRIHRLVGFLGLVASVILIIATETHAVLFTLPKGSLSANGSSRAIITRREWDMSGSKHIPEWLVLLSREPMTREEIAKMKSEADKDETYIDYLFDGNFLGFGILYNIGLKNAMMLASLRSFLTASQLKGRLLRGWDMVYQHPRLGPTETTWHEKNESYRWAHLITLGKANIGIFHIQYDQVYRDGIKDPEPPPIEPPPSSSPKPKVRSTLGLDGESRQYFRPRTTTTTTIKPTPNGTDEDGEPTPPPLPAKYWSLQLVYPERPILDKNCWAYSYASYYDGTVRDPRDPPMPRFWARWPVKAIEDCNVAKPLCKFVFDVDRAIRQARGNNVDPKDIAAQGFPCYRWQDQGAPIFCSEDKEGSDHADPSKMELSYVISSYHTHEESANATELTEDFASNCYQESPIAFHAFNLQEMTFILKNPALLERAGLAGRNFESAEACVGQCG